MRSRVIADGSGPCRALAYSHARSSSLLPRTPCVTHRAQLAGGEELRRLRARRPPDLHMRLDLGELREGELHLLLGRGINLLALEAARQHRRLVIVVEAIIERARAGEVLDVPEILPRLRAL